MNATEIKGPNFGPTERAVLKDLHETLEKYDGKAREDLLRELRRIPSMAELLKRADPKQLEAQDTLSRTLTRQAFLEGAWGPLVENQRQQGAMYASMAVPFVDWFDVVSVFQKSIVPLIVQDHAKDPPRLSAMLVALDTYLGFAMGVIGDEYLKTKERIIGQQQEAIQELSTPVLQIRDHVLLVPLVGVLDSSRARLLTQQLLGAIRTHRAKIVVIDITGVAAVDSKVANHIFQTVAAVKLMGAQSIITGLSAEVAEALVGLGVDVNRLNTVTDLQGGMEEVNRLLGVKIVKEAH